MSTHTIQYVFPLLVIVEITPPCQSQRVKYLFKIPVQADEDRLKPPEDPEDPEGDPERMRLGGGHGNSDGLLLDVEFTLRRG